MILIQISVYKTSLKKTTTRSIQAKNSPIHPRNSRFSSGFLVFPQPNQGTPARICTKTFPTLIGRNSLVVVWSRSAFKRDVHLSHEKKPAQVSMASWFGS